jgi:hypothetical protein
VRVLRPGSQTTANRKQRREQSQSTRRPLAAVLGMLLVGAIAAYGYSTLKSSYSNGPVPDSAPAPAHTEPSFVDQTFTCDGRTHCSQMTSCPEATYFLQHCPNTQMDGDHDRIPCEQQWCTAE